MYYPLCPQLPAWEPAAQLALARLPALQELLWQQYGITAHFGCELEWYLARGGDGVTPESAAALHCAVEAWARAEALAITPIKPEMGKNQFETGFDVSADAATLAQDIARFRHGLMEQAQSHGMAVLWDAKPYPQDYGSALQLHVHLLDRQGQWLLHKREAELSPTLADVLGGLLAITPEAIRVAAPQEASYARFVPKYDAPVTLCWGGNNRSTTLRLPLRYGGQCHVEYRLAGADADAASMLGVVMAGVLHGLDAHPAPGLQVHGVASDAQYALPRLANTPQESERLFNSGRILHRYLGQAWCNAVASVS